MFNSSKSELAGALGPHHAVFQPVIMAQTHRTSEGSNRALASGPGDSSACDDPLANEMRVIRESISWNTPPKNTSTQDKSDNGSPRPRPALSSDTLSSAATSTQLQGTEQSNEIQRIQPPSTTTEGRSLSSLEAQSQTGVAFIPVSSLYELQRNAATTISKTLGESSKSADVPLRIPTNGAEVQGGTREGPPQRSQQYKQSVPASKEAPSVSALGEGEKASQVSKEKGLPNTPPSTDPSRPNGTLAPSLLPSNAGSPHASTSNVRIAISLAYHYQYSFSRLAPFKRRVKRRPKSTSHTLSFISRRSLEAFHCRKPDAINAVRVAQGDDSSTGNG